MRVLLVYILFELISTFWMLYDTVEVQTFYLNPKKMAKEENISLWFFIFLVVLFYATFPLFLIIRFLDWLIHIGVNKDDEL